MRPPGFWERPGSAAAALLSPAAMVWRIATARRLARTGWRAPVPVICIGNATVGGAGKTPVAIDVALRLAREGHAPHLLTRGYGAASRGNRRVDLADDAAMVGDEALLLTRVAPCWIGADRAALARRAVDAGADCLVMDDGLQNPGLEKTASLLVVDAASGFGNGRIVPAGPLREPVGSAASRCRAAVLIGDGAHPSLRALAALPVLRAALRPDAVLAAYAGQEVGALAGIAHPEKFFAMLEAHGVRVRERLVFPDHHRFSAAEVDRIARAAERMTVLTTEKDVVRLPAAVAARVVAIPVSLVWEDEAAVDALLASLFPAEGAG